MLKTIAVKAGTETEEAIDKAIEALEDQTAYKWHFFGFRKATEEEKEYYKEHYDVDDDELEMIENVPGDGEEVLVWTKYGFVVDTYDDGMFEGIGEIEKGMAWRYLPLRPREDEQE